MTRIGMCAAALLGKLSEPKSAPLHAIAALAACGDMLARADVRWHRLADLSHPRQAVAALAQWRLGRPDRGLRPMTDHGMPRS